MGVVQLRPYPRLADVCFLFGGNALRDDLAGNQPNRMAYRCGCVAWIRCPGQGVCAFGTGPSLRLARSNKVERPVSLAAHGRLPRRSGAMVCALLSAKRSALHSDVLLGTPCRTLPIHCAVAHTALLVLRSSLGGGSFPLDSGHRPPS